MSRQVFPQRTVPPSSWKATVERSLRKPLQVGLELVGEFALAMRPDLASKEALEAQLRKQHRGDDRGDGIRFLGFLDEIPRWRRARVTMAGVPVGMLFETQVGSRFEYEAAYLRRADAVPLFAHPTTEFEVIFGARPPPVLCQFTTRRDTARLDLPTQGPRPAGRIRCSSRDRA